MDSTQPETMSYRALHDEGMSRIREVGAEEFLNLGAETRSQNRLNREYIESLTFEMRFLGSGFASTRTELLGHEVAYPIQCAAVCDGRLLNALSTYWEAPYLEEIAEGIAEAGSWMWIGELEGHRLQRLVNIGVPIVRIVKPYYNAKWDESTEVIRQLKEAEERGCIAVGMDIDVFFGEKTGDEPPYRYALGPQALELMEQYVAATDLPFIVKGVLSEHDAMKSREVGASGVVVSHHGGEAIDFAVPILRVLPAIRQAWPDATIFAETGFQRGTDVLKALALGADGVCMLNTLIVAYAAAGGRGVRDMLLTLAEELSRNMSICGATSIDEVDESILWKPYPDRGRGE